MNAVDTFRSKSSGIVAKLLGDFPIHNDDGFAIVGNLGHECKGFTTLQEVKPAVKGSRGGYGWPQWTGPRRRAYEAYCQRNRLDPASDEANYAFLFLELKGSEAKAIPALLKGAGLEAKVQAFEQKFLRAGVKHYHSREIWARLARDEWQKSGRAPAPTPATRQREILHDEAVAADKRASNAVQLGSSSGGTGVIAAGGPALDGLQLADLLLMGLGVAAVAAAVILFVKARKNAKTAANLRHAFDATYFRLETDNA